MRELFISSMIVLAFVAVLILALTGCGVNPTRDNGGGWTQITRGVGDQMRR